LQDRVRDHADSYVDCLDVVLDLCDRFLDFLERACIGEGLACVIDLLLNLGESLVDVCQFRFHVLDSAGCGIEGGLDLTELIRMSAVITCHALEALGKKTLFLGNALESAGDLIREALEFDPHVWQSPADLVSVLLGLVKM
jgi:hypothetical protein